MFPRIKQFDFVIERKYKVPDKYIGRLDLIAMELYGDPRFYKALLGANSITMPMGCRIGVRPVYTAINNEFSSNQSIYLDKVDAHRTTDLDWVDLTNTSSGYMSDIYLDRILNIPTPESATRYMNIYGYLTKD
jgi:hypothetical protein